MKIKWNEVTRFSQAVAIVLFLVVYFIGFCVGQKYEGKSILGDSINDVKFVCADNKYIQADFYETFVHIKTNDGKNMYLPHAISASGARYANSDESFVFWNKGNTAFVTEENPNVQTYSDCVIK